MKLTPTARIVKKLLIAGCSALVLAGCAQSVPPMASEESVVTLQHLYDYQLLDDTGEFTSWQQLVNELATADVIFVGEYHSHPASHLLQMQLLAALHQQNPALILSMEQFSRDHQAEVNQYLKGQIGEQVLIKQGNAWDNYASDYRPLVDYARQHQLPVVAANTPLSVVRCVAQHGPDVVPLLSKEAQRWVAADLSNADPAYLNKYAGISHAVSKPADEKDKEAEHSAAHPSHTAKASGHGSKKRYSFSAQLARDNTMAESIYRALQAAPEHRVIHLNGSFHSEEHSGTVAALKRLNPELSIKVITPLFSDEGEALVGNSGRAKGDFIYRILPLPERYIQAENRNRAIQQMMGQMAEQRCELME